MNNFRVFSALALLVGLTACGGASYDADYDCEQTRACALEQGMTPPGSQDECTENSEAVFDSKGDTEKKLIEEAFDACKDETACAYLACLAP